MTNIVSDVPTPWNDLPSIRWSLSFWPPTCLGPFQGPYLYPINLTVHTWKKHDRGFPKFVRSPKHLHVITNSKLWSWNNFFALSIIIRKQTSIKHVREKTDLSFSSLYRKLYCKIIAIWRGCYRLCRFKSWYVPAIEVKILNGLHVDRFCWL